MANIIPRHIRKELVKIHKAACRTRNAINTAETMPNPVIRNDSCIKRDLILGFDIIFIVRSILSQFLPGRAAYIMSAGGIPFVTHATDGNDFPGFSGFVFYFHAQPANIYRQSFVVYIIFITIPEVSKNLFR